MRATKEYVERLFDEFNRLCFDGKLPHLPIETTQARTFLGVFYHRKRRGEDGSEEPYDMKLRISTVYDMDEEIVKDTILHEMIHYYITYNRIKDTSIHGEEFRKMMNDFNQRFGRHVTISHRGSREEVDSDDRKTGHFICVCDIGYDKVFVQCAKTKVLSIHNQLTEDKRISKIAWYYTENPFFNRFPNSTKARLLKINRVELIDNLKDAAEMECDGLRFRSKRK